MRTFQVSDAFFERMRQNHVKYFIPMLAIGLAIGFSSNFDSTAPIPSVVAMATVVVLVVVSAYRADRRQMKLWRTFRITVDADLLTRTQDGFGDVTLRADRITRIEEISGVGLSVYAEGAQPAITIPDTLIDYEACRSLLNQWRPVERKAKSMLRRFFWPLMPLALFTLLPSYFSTDPRQEAIHCRA